MQFWLMFNVIQLFFEIVWSFFRFLVILRREVIELYEKLFFKINFSGGLEGKQLEVKEVYLRDQFDVEIKDRYSFISWGSIRKKIKNKEGLDMIMI